MRSTRLSEPATNGRATGRKIVERAKSPTCRLGVLAGSLIGNLSPGWDLDGWWIKAYRFGLAIDLQSKEADGLTVAARTASSDSCFWNKSTPPLSKEPATLLLPLPRGLTGY
ncbi:hypothetical protein Tco_0265285 [Tanacetum coccineum]